MLCSLLVFVYEGIAFNVVYLCRVLPALGKGMLICPSAVAFNTAWCLAVWSYVAAHAADPGIVPQRWYDFATHAGEELAVVPARLEWQPGKAGRTWGPPHAHTVAVRWSRAPCLAPKPEGAEPPTPPVGACACRRHPHTIPAHKRGGAGGSALRFSKI